MVAEAAARCGYPLWVLRLSLDTYRMERRVIIDGACSRAILATQGITAGSGFATEELCCLLLDVMDELKETLPKTALALYVDDGTVEAEGSRRDTAGMLKCATRILVDGMKKVGLALSTTKSVVLSTCRQVARNVAKSAKDGGGKLLRVRTSTKMLGVGTAAGGRRCTSTQKVRHNALKEKVPRVTALRRAGVDTSVWMRVAGNSSLTYGEDTMGVADTALDQQRSTAAKISSAPGGGKQKDLALWHADARGQTTDPAFHAHELPITALAKAAWENWWGTTEQGQGAAVQRKGREALGAALQTAYDSLNNAQFAWARVAGPFAATAASAHRLGWKYLGGLKFRADDDEHIDLAGCAPQYVKLRVRKSVRRWRDRRVNEQLHGIDIGPEGLATKGVNQAAKPPKAKDPLAPHWVGGCASALRSAVANGQWPQVRLKAAGLAEDDRCQHCLVHKGTTAHRRVCECTKHMRGPGGVPSHLRSTFDELTEDRQRHLLTRGLLALPSVASHPPSAHDTLSWTVYPEGGVLHTGWIAYLDGSFRDGPTELIGRTGFGFVAYDNNGVLRAAACGVPPPWIRSIHGAELWALFAAARISLPGVAFRTDRKAILDTFRAGRKEATAASVELAQLWRMVFGAFDDHGSPADVVDLAWMPAHTKPGDIGNVALSNGLLLTTRDRAANDAADFLAKRGAQSHRVPREVRKRVKNYELLAEWAARTLAIATYAANNLIVPGKDGLQRDSTGLPAWKRKPKAAAEPANPDTVATFGVETVPAACPSTKPLARRAPSVSSSCSSSEVDLNAAKKSHTARQCRARLRSASRERTAELVKRNSCFAVPDEGEATAPHRLRHLTDRVLRKAARPRACVQAPAEPLGEPSDSRGGASRVLEGEPGPVPDGDTAELHRRRRPLRQRATASSSSARASADALRSLLS